MTPYDVMTENRRPEDDKLYFYIGIAFIVAVIICACL
jgi:hypothetical protein